MKSLKLKSPAKINLFLRIIGKRPDGFHELASLFQAIDLCDEVMIQESSRDAFTCSDESLPLDENNLVIKALNLFRTKTGITVPCSIHLKKNIPYLAGLGGGSSNAATTLYGLNTLFGMPAKMDQLMAWSAEIGSDIPFFFTSGTAYVTGRGERVESLDPLQKREILIVKPPQGLSSGQVYKSYQPLKSEQRDPKKYLEDFKEGKIVPFNDLETPAFAAMPQLNDLKLQLENKGLHPVCMSGSGTAFFCFGEGSMSKDENLYIKRTTYINRLEDCWYP